MCSCCVYELQQRNGGDFFNFGTYTTRYGNKRKRNFSITEKYLFGQRSLQKPKGSRFLLTIRYATRQMYSMVLSARQACVCLLQKDGQGEAHPLEYTKKREKNAGESERTPSGG